MIDLFVWIAVVASAFVAGVMNSMAGGGTFLTFPALQGLAGLSDKVANVTSTLALWPGSLAAMVAKRREIADVPRRQLYLLSLVSLIGGLIGAILLMATPELVFRLVIPVLLAFGTAVFALSERIRAFVQRREGRSRRWALVVGSVQFLVAVYGGYFGAGIGVLMLAALSLLDLPSLHVTNALKVFLGTLINAVAIVVFVASGEIDYRYGPAMAIAAMAGGYCGAIWARRLSVERLRAAIIAIGCVLTAAYAWRAYVA